MATVLGCALEKIRDGEIALDPVGVQVIRMHGGVRVVHGIAAAVGWVGGVGESSCHGLRASAASMHGAVGVHGGGVVGRERATVAAGRRGVVVGGVRLLLVAARVCGRDGSSRGDWGQGRHWSRRGRNM